MAQGRITVNAPAEKRRSAFDLPIALAILAASGQIPRELDRHAVHGELALDGRVRPVAGVFAVAEGAQRARLPGSSAPPALRRRLRWRESSRSAWPTLRRRSPTSAASTSRSPFAHATARASACARPGRRARAGRARRARARSRRWAQPAPRRTAGDGQNNARRASPACCRRLTSRRRSKSRGSTQSPESSRSSIRSSRFPPFRAPHHTASAAAIVGGGQGAASGRGQPCAPRRALARRAPGSSGRRSRRCASRSRMGASPSRAPRGRRSIRRAFNCSRR